MSKEDKTKKEPDDDSTVDFYGAKLDKQQASVLTFTVSFTILSTLTLLSMYIVKDYIIISCVVVVISVIGYLLGNKLFKNKSDQR